MRVILVEMMYNYVKRKRLLLGHSFSAFGKRILITITSDLGDSILCNLDGGSALMCCSAFHGNGNHLLKQMIITFKII